MKIFWISIGLICLALGSVGLFLPVLPTVPFYLVTVYSFGKSSDRLHQWFLSTNVYKNHVEDFVTKKQMARSSKIKLIAAVSVVMAIGFYFMKDVPIGRLCLVVVWICHVIYFGFMVGNTHD